MKHPNTGMFYISSLKNDPVRVVEWLFCDKVFSYGILLRRNHRTVREMQQHGNCIHKLQNSCLEVSVLPPQSFSWGGLLNELHYTSYAQLIIFARGSFVLLAGVVE